MNKNSYVLISNLSLSLNGKQVLKNINIQLFRGRIYGLIGPSGSGKSVFLKTLCGIFTNFSGRIHFEAVNQIAAQFQEGGLIDYLTTADNIAVQILRGRQFLSELNYREKKDVFNKVYSAAEFLNIKEALFKYPHELSGGMKKRVVLGRALVGEPDLLILDDPLAGLDPINSKNAVRKILNITNSFKPVTLISFHSLRFIWNHVSSIIFFENGECKFFQEKNEIKSSDRVLKFVSCKEDIFDV
ncbi:MAG: ATP-binding cassette domain-containing protein [Deltaproteobacteria bacterium]|nr:ATP-binding cassette domain-containing protein [Deltaproteobacteria bacterium]